MVIIGKTTWLFINYTIYCYNIAIIKILAKMRMAIFQRL